MNERFFWQLLLYMSVAYVTYYAGMVILNTPLPTP